MSEACAPKKGDAIGHSIVHTINAATERRDLSLINAAISPKSINQD